MPATNINTRISAISPDRSKFVSAMSYYPGLEIFEVGADSAERYVQNSGTIAQNTFELESFRNREYREYYKYVDATNNYIYLLHSGFKEKKSANHETQIQVIDWDGNPQIK